MKHIIKILTLTLVLSSVHVYAGAEVENINACNIDEIKKEIKNLCEGKSGKEKRDCKKETKERKKQLKAELKACKQSNKAKDKNLKECFTYNAKKGEVKNKAKKSCSGKWSESADEAINKAQEKCQKKKNHLWIDKGNGAYFCEKDTKAMKNLLKSKGVDDRKAIKACKKAIKKGRTLAPNAGMEEALNLLKQNNCDLEALLGQTITE